MAGKEILQKPGIYFGYYILVASFVILFFNSGARFSIGVVFKPMIAEFGWDRGSISLAVFINMAAFALSLTVVGRLYDRFGPKWVIIISTFFLSGGYGLIALMDSLWQFLLFYGVIAAVGTGGTSATLIATLTSKWFQRGRGLAISLALSGHCLGQFILVPLFEVLVRQYNWRILYAGLGLLMAAINIVIALFVIKGDPEDFGLEPLDQASARTSPQDLGLREAMGTYSFWLFLITMFVCGAGDFLITTHFIPFATDCHIPSSTASQMLGWFGLMSLAGILIAGPASDRIGNKIPIALTFGLRVLLFLLILKYQNLFSLYLFGLLFGFTFLITAPLTTTLIGRLYGWTHVGLISGFITTIHHLAGGFWVYLGGLIFDRTGSYQLIFIFSLIMALVAVLCSLWIKEERHTVHSSVMLR